MSIPFFPSVNQFLPPSLAGENGRSLGKLESRNFFPRLHRKGLNEKKRRKKEKRKERKKKREQKFISLLNSNVKRRRVVCSYERRKKKKEKKERKGKVLQRNEDETSKVPFSIAFSRLKALFSLSSRGKHAQVCVSPRWKSALLPYLARSPRKGGDDTTHVSFRNEIVENFILEETDPPNRIQRVAR